MHSIKYIEHWKGNVRTISRIIGHFHIQQMRCNINYKTMNWQSLSSHQVHADTISQDSHQDEYQTKKITTNVVEADTSTADNTIDVVKKREAVSSTEEGYESELHIEDNSVNEIKDTSNNKHTVDDVFNRVDLAIPYDSLGWFSKFVEGVLDGSLYIGLALGIMFFSGSVLSGAIGLFGDTCLICAFIGYANTVGPWGMLICNSV